jgi:UPF0755 protein
MTIPEIISKLTQGETKSNVARVTIPEGFNIYEIDKRLDGKDVISRGELVQFASSNSVDLSCRFGDSLSCDLVIVPCSEAEPSSVSCSLVSSLEGYLFPDTYKFNKGASVEAIVEKMLINFEKKLKTLNFTEQDTELNTELSATEFRDVPRSPSAKFRDILTVASIAEKEVRSFEKKKIVAGVIYNRLQAGMKLDSCPTVIYAQILATGDPYEFVETKREHNPVTIMDTEIESPYNTYQNKGLPPTPISNPGLEAIKAALNPAENGYLYYLSNPAGETLFSETYEEHLRKKEEYLR